LFCKLLGRVFLHHRRGHELLEGSQPWTRVRLGDWVPEPDDSTPAQVRNAATLTARRSAVGRRLRNRDRRTAPSAAFSWAARPVPRRCPRGRGRTTAGSELLLNRARETLGICRA